MKTMIYFLSLSALIACQKYKNANSDTQSNYNCQCETKTEFIDNCRLDSVENNQTVTAKSRSEAEKLCKELNFENANIETKTSKKCELR